MFVNEIRRARDSALDAIEFVEEPLEIQTGDGGKWDLGVQVAALLAFADGTAEASGTRLTKTLADLAVLHDHDFDGIAPDLRKAFGGESGGRTGCVAFVLKPALLGLELSMRIAKLARRQFGIAPASDEGSPSVSTSP